MSANIAAAVKAFILSDVWPDGDPAQLDDARALMGEGILDSLALLRLVAFLEKTYGIKVEAHETDEDNFGTLADIVRFVGDKGGVA